MYENGKMRPVEAVLGKGEDRIKDKIVWGGSNLRHIANIFVNVTMYPWYNYNVLINK
jgi:hypothetical protein